MGVVLLIKKGIFDVVEKEYLLVAHSDFVANTVGTRILEAIIKPLKGVIGSDN